MIGSSIPVWPSLLLSFVIIFKKGDCVCSNSKTEYPARFENLIPDKGEYKYTLFLLVGFQLELSCCVVSTSPSVTWHLNGTAIKEFGDMFELFENGQYLTSVGEALINNTVLGGVYNCTAVVGNETISAEYIVTPFPDDHTCTNGKTTDVKLGHPPSSLYGIVSNSSLVLECTVLLTCHVFDAFESIYWEKFYIKDATDAKMSDNVPDDPSWFTSFILFATDQYDMETGSYVNVTKRRLSQNHVLVTTVLNITKITDNDLHDVHNPDGYAYLSCENKTNMACLTNRTKNYYRCGNNAWGTINPLQNALKTSRTVTLFSGFPPTLPTQMTIISGNNNIEQEGVIIGSTIGAAFILVIVFALLFVAYEWHLKLYIRRVFLQLRKNEGTKTANYKYNCYVTCCMKDDRFVYDVLRSQMEEQHGYQLCLPDRDFNIGTAIPDEIERCIRSSEYFMAVISPGFWETDWCSLSVDLALRTNAKIVAVIAKELSKDQRDQGNRLMTALKSPGCTRIVNSLLRQETSWDNLVLRLRYAMPRLD